MMERYLFIGGAGFIGSSIIRYMQGQPDCPHITVLEPEFADISRLKECSVTLVRGELRDTELLERIIEEHRITRVVHLVSAMTPGSRHDDYTEELRSIVRPTIALLEICSRRGVKFIYFSSGGAIYGESEDGRPFREQDPMRPISYYGLSKLIVESNIRFEHRTAGLRYLILRPSNPYGFGQNIHGRQGIIAVSIGKILAGQPVTVLGDGSAVRDYIYIDDLARIVCAVLRSCAENEAINIGSGTGLSVKDILGYINDVVAAPFYTQYAQGRKSDVSSVVLDISRMQQICSVRFTPIRKGIREFYKKLLS